MKKGKLRYLGFLGFIGIIGLLIDNPGMFGFFGFFGFFAATFQKQDELLELNLNKAGMNGFVVSLLGLAVAIMLVAYQRSIVWLAPIVGIVFAAQILTFTISLLVYEKKGGGDDVQ